MYEENEPAMKSNEIGMTRMIRNCFFFSLDESGEMADASSYLKLISSDNKVILNSSSIFSGNLETLRIL